MSLPLGRHYLPRFQSFKRPHRANQGAVRTRPNSMGAGGDGRPTDSVIAKARGSIGLPSMDTLKNDLTVLRHLWFSKASGGDHASRLESFYGPQAEACECTPVPVPCGRGLRLQDDAAVQVAVGLALPAACREACSPRSGPISGQGSLDPL